MCYFTDVRHPVDIALGLKSTNLSLVGEFGVLNGFLLTLKSINYFYFKTRHIFVLKTLIFYLLILWLLFAPLPISCPFTWV